MSWIIKNNKFDLLPYKILIQSIGWSYKNLDISDLDEKKFLSLIQSDRFQFEKSNFIKLKEKGNNLHLELIKKNKDVLIDEFDNFDFGAEDIIEIFQIDESDLSDAIKTELTEKVSDELITDKIIANLIDKYADKTKAKSLEYTKRMFELVDSLESKINLVISINDQIKDDVMIQMLNSLPGDYSSITKFDGKRVYLVNNEINQKLLQLLQARKFITSFKEEDDGIKVIVKNRNR